MAAISILGALALAASLDALVPGPTAMGSPAPVEVEGWYQAIEKSKAMETLHIAIHVMHKHLEELPSLVHGDGNQGENRGGGADAIRYIGTGMPQPFPVAAVDITAPLTSTSRCDPGGTGRPVACSNLACSTMAPRQPLCASSPIPPTCAYDTSTVLYQGPIILASASVTHRSPESTVYACRVQQAVGASSSGGMAAVLGLGWRGAQSLGLQGFSYYVSSNGNISVSVGAGGDVPVARGGGTAALLSDPRNYPDLYYVRVTGIQVGEDLQQVSFPRSGALDLRRDGSGGGVFLSTTMPLTLLNGGVYNSLIRTLNAALPPASIARSDLSPRQLCYRRGTQTPTITLVLDDGGATMKLPAENCWYKQPSDGSWTWCLAILPSPWPTGESLLGTMMQSGWRMTYNLNARTLTFQWSSSPPAAVLPNSSCVLWVLLLAAAAHVAFTFL